MALPDDETLVRVAPSSSLEERDVRLVARDGRKDLFVSSSLSEGLRDPIGIFFIGDGPRTGSDMAEGKSVGRFRSTPGLEEVVGGCPTFSFLGLEISKLLVLCIGSGLLDSSVLLPVPRITTGASLSRKKSSISVLVVLVTLLLRLDGVRSKLSVVVPALADRPMLVVLTVLPLRPRTAYLP